MPCVQKSCWSPQNFVLNSSKSSNRWRQLLLQLQHHKIQSLLFIFYSFAAILFVFQASVIVDKLSPSTTVSFYFDFYTSLTHEWSKEMLTCNLMPWPAHRPRSGPDDRSGPAAAARLPRHGHEDGDLVDPHLWQAAVLPARHSAAHAVPQPATSQLHHHQTMGKKCQGTFILTCRKKKIPVSSMISFKCVSVSHCCTFKSFSLLLGRIFIWSLKKTFPICKTGFCVLPRLCCDQGFPEVVRWLDDVELLLVCTPLASVLPRTWLLVDDIANVSAKPFNTQQVTHSPSSTLLCASWKVCCQLMRPRHRRVEQFS